MKKIVFVGVSSALLFFAWTSPEPPQGPEIKPISFQEYPQQAPDYGDRG